MHLLVIKTVIQIDSCMTKAFHPALQTSIHLGLAINHSTLGLLAMVTHCMAIMSVHDAAYNAAR